MSKPFPAISFLLLVEAKTGLGARRWNWRHSHTTLTACTFYMLFISLFKAFKLWEWPKEIYEHESGKGLHCPIPSKWQAKQGWGMIGRTTEHVQECCASLYLRLVRTRHKVAAPCCSDKSLLAATTGSCPTFIQSDPAL